MKIRILADVVSPLCGHQGATYTFGKQKGLDPSLFETVDIAIQEFYEKFSPSTLSLKGAGAGGGIAAGLCAFAEATIVSGIDTCLDLIDFDKKVAGADLVIVGEGRLDSQSFVGKAPIGVAKRTLTEFLLLLFVVVLLRICLPYHLKIYKQYSLS